MVRPTHAVVDLARLVSNYRAIREHLAASAGGAPPRVIAVIKANAYGHGAVAVARALEAAEAESGGVTLACADIEEGIELREAGIQAPVLVFGALSVSDLEGVFRHRLTPTVSSPSAARRLAAAAATRGRRLGVHVKVDTGMNRFGFRHDNLRRTIPALGAGAGGPLRVEAVYTHFATAESAGHPLFDRQRACFEAVRAVLSELGVRGVSCHAANSAALLRDRRTWYEAVRPGLLLYGIVPPPLESAIPVRPVLSLRSRVVAVKGMRAGETAGYGARFAAPRAMRAAVVPAGYADGLDLRLAGAASVLVRGRRAPVIAVSMDSTIVDVTDVEVSPGDPVVIIGEQGGDSIDARELARVIGTVPHEILCRTGARIARVHQGL
ncbi:MAG: alanine racemase [Acidobacteria bacterium]|nr:alanine racemase [Acidobacteriota bacterium]